MMKNILTKKYIIIFSAILVIILIAVFVFAFNKNGVDQIFTVEKGSLSQTVSVTGKTKALSNVNLGFSKGGKVAKVYVDVGSVVEVGEPLVELDKSELDASLLQAQANFQTEQSRLDELEKGSRPEEIKVSEANLFAAQTTATNAINSLINALNDAYSKTDDIIHNQIDTVFNGGTSGAPQFKSSTMDGFLSSTVEAQRRITEYKIIDWQNIKISKTISTSDLSKTALTIQEYLSYIQNFLDNVSKGFSSKDTGEMATSRDVVASARTSFNTVITNVQTAISTFNSANSSLAQAIASNTLINNGNTPEVISAQRAKVLQAKAQVENVNAQINNAILFAPISGIITVRDLKVGEIAPANTSVISIISDTGFEIEANISEVNIRKVGTGNRVNISLDAFPGETFVGEVYYIDPAETLVDNVVNYKTKIRFDSKNRNIKSGMTVDLKIQTDNRDNVIVIPLYMVSKTAQGSFVKRYGTGELIKIELGIVGDNGIVEVLSGLKSGDKIISAN